MRPSVLKVRAETLLLCPHKLHAVSPVAASQAWMALSPVDATIHLPSGEIAAERMSPREEEFRLLPSASGKLVSLPGANSHR